MRIACLIQDSPPLVYFVNRIHHHHPVDLVIVERPPAPTLASFLRRRGVGGSLSLIRRRLTGGSRTRRRRRDYQRFFGDDGRALRSDLDVMKVGDVNAPEVRAQLLERRVDVLLDHGTRIVKDDILATTPLALNLHWGLSPYYRGVFCTEWALINWDPYNIGVTIHRLSNIVDGGDILAQARAEVTAADTAHSINMQLTVLGTALVIEALNRKAAGQAYEFVRQDLSRGHAVYRRQWSDQLSRQITHIERHGLIGAMLRKPSRPERLPVVSLA